MWNLPRLMNCELSAHLSLSGDMFHTSSHLISYLPHSFQVNFIIKMMFIINIRDRTWVHILFFCNSSIQKPLLESPGFLVYPLNQHT